MYTPEELHRTPNALAKHYRRFRVDERLLLTGHSHQAWPDRGFEAQQQAWLDAAELVDEKWERAFEQVEAVGRGFARLLDDTTGEYALASNTHDLLLRFLSALPLRDRPRLLTTDGEFHTVRRQLARLREEGLEIVRVPHEPAEEVVARLTAALDSRTAAVIVSSVFYDNGNRLPHLRGLAEACDRQGAELLVDTYHSLNAVPFTIPEQGMGNAFLVGGGYKYCQLGEGNCFLRIPEGNTSRPVITGWFGEFGLLGESLDPDEVRYGEGASRFAGSTFDPTSQYRAAAVFAFFREHELTVDLLREVNQHQLRLLADGIDRLDPPPTLLRRPTDVPLSSLGGFLTLRSPRAAELCLELRRHGVHTDQRGESLRFGPAPYLSDQQLHEVIAVLEEVVKSI